jgi:hypothetical protein
MGGGDQPHRVSPHSGGLPCTSEFYCWPLRSLTIRMRSHYTPIYYRKSPVPSRELYTNPARSTHNFVVTQLCAPAHRGVPTYYLLISLDLRTIPRTAHNGRDSVLITCINCLHTASSAQDVLTMLRNSPRVRPTTPPRHSDGNTNQPTSRRPASTAGIKINIKLTH